MNQHAPKSFKQQEVTIDLPSGNTCSRLLTARAIAAVRRAKVEDVVESLWPNDKLISTIVRAASAPAMTAVTGWAKELAQIRVADAVDALGAYSSAVEIMENSLLLAWDGYGQISVPGFVASAANGGFVADGDPIPVRQLVDAAQPLLPHKVASIAVLTEEMINSSNAEALITDTLVKSAGLAIDAAFFDANASSSARPAGVRNGVAALTASSNTDSFGGAFEDVSTLMGGVGQVGGKGPYYIASSIGRIASLQMRWAEQVDIIGMVMSPAIGNDLMAIAPQALAAAVDPAPAIEVANAGTLYMDTAPGAVGTTPGPERSLFQTRSTAVKVRWPVSWALRDPRGVAWLTPGWK